MGEYKNRVATTNTVVFNDKAEVLLAKRGAEPFKGWWGLPGGYMEWGETVEQGARRELKEETDLDVIEMKFIGYFDAPERSPSPSKPISFCFVAKVTGTPKAADDATELKFFSVSDLPELAFDHREMIELALKTAATP
jgi:ADP-ribose pyrophosphatase YjhB (NUDIX family)